MDTVRGGPDRGGGAVHFGASATAAIDCGVCTFDVPGRKFYRRAWRAREQRGRCARRAFESKIIDAALERGLPLLGICRGAQLLNVRLGGDLYQDLGRMRRHTSRRRTLLPLKRTFIEPGTRLHRLLGCGSLRVNSLHNQSIKRLGDGVSVSARDRDAIVQAIEVAGPYTIGVQWHPEYLLYSARQRRLFAGLVAAARGAASASAHFMR